MRKRLEAFPLSEFCRVERVTAKTVLGAWTISGRAPRLQCINDRYRITREAWNAWRRRLEADRIRTANPRLRAPLPTMQLKRAKIAMRVSTEGL
jgi:hypothetical protein